MAITSIDYLVWKALYLQKALPSNPDVLEIGESNWYNDLKVEQLTVDFLGVFPEYAKEVEEIHAKASEYAFFDIAKAFYRAILNCKSITSIDMTGSPSALHYDLNLPLTIDKRFHITINGGTAEHIFNQYQVFKTIHDLTLPDGVMYHTLPFRGWLDHGFYNYNPTFLVDLAASNSYTMMVWLYGELNELRIVQVRDMEQIHEMVKMDELGPNSSHYVVFKKADKESVFVAPQQGYYAGKVSKSLGGDWEELR